MKFIGWLLRLAFFFVVFWFALNNTTPVSLNWGQSVVWSDVPLIVVILISMVIGALACAIALMPRLLRLRGSSAPTKPAAAPSTSTPVVSESAEQLADRMANAARNVGAVGELDADTRIPRSNPRL